MQTQAELTGRVSGVGAMGGKQEKDGGNSEMREYGEGRRGREGEKEGGRKRGMG